jgi:hypothetical protein
MFQLDSNGIQKIRHQNVFFEYIQVAFGATCLTMLTLGMASICKVLSKNDSLYIDLNRGTSNKHTNVTFPLVTVNQDNIFQPIRQDQQIFVSRAFGLPPQFIKGQN